MHKKVDNTSFKVFDVTLPRSNSASRQTQYMQINQILHTFDIFPVFLCKYLYRTVTYLFVSDTSR